MEAGSTLLGRLGEKVLGWAALGLILLVAVAVYQTPADTKQAIWSGLWRSIMWLSIVAIVPWSARLYIRRVLEVGENWAGLALIVGLTLVDVLAGWWLMTAWPVSGWAWLTIIGALGLAATYNYFVTEYLAEISGG